MTSTHLAELPIPALPLAVHLAHIVPALQYLSLVSIGTLCDAVCDVTFTITTVTVEHNDAIVMAGTGLWHFAIPSPAGPIAPTLLRNNALAMSIIGYPNAAELVASAHAALFSPALCTLETTLQRGYIRNLPGLTAKTLRRHPPQSVATAKGHLDQVRKNLRLTKPKPVPFPTGDPNIAAAVHSELFPEHEDKTHDCYVAVRLLYEPTGKVYTDQTGKFPCTSACGNNYVMILYDHDSIAILMEPLRNRKGPALLEAHTKLHAKLTHAGLRPPFIMMDNECTNAFKHFYTKRRLIFN